MDKTDIKSMNLTELTEYLMSVGQPKFRGKQLYEWMHVKLADSPDKMTNLPAALREYISRKCSYTALKPVKIQVSKEDMTAKYLFELEDGNLIESVLMRYHHGNSVCISSQAGCRMGCKFCASTLDGLARNLKPSEMLDQIYRIQSLTGEMVSNVVVMGSGEPFDNFDNFLKFQELLTDGNGLNISARNLTVSTCGIVPRIYELADRKLQITLAISLHSPTDEMRRKLMPIANKYSIEEIMKACRYYIDKTGRRVTFEYSLVKGENDSPKCAAMLAGLVKGMNCHINLIPVNPIKERNFRQTEVTDINKFKNILEKYKINVTIRREMGRDIDGACGQLRKRYSDEHLKEQL
ncbi:MAG: 23S rRNA (adenine(2503)-C(2))-methyltransferase RlmN [Butyrivibrio sp.]